MKIPINRTILVEIMSVPIELVRTEVRPMYLARYPEKVIDLACGLIQGASPELQCELLSDADFRNRLLDALDGFDGDPSDQARELENLFAEQNKTSARELLNLAFEY